MNSIIELTLYNYFCKTTDVKEIRKMRNCVMLFSASIVACALETLIVSYIFLPKEVKYAFDMIKKVIK